MLGASTLASWETLGRSRDDPGTLGSTRKEKIRGVQRSMLRRFAGPRRRTDEDFLSWIRRSTHAAVEAASVAGVRCWVADHLKAKWCWAGHVTRMREYRPESWAYKATFWRASQWRSDYAVGSYLHSGRPLRSRAGRWSRWEDEIVLGFQHIGEGSWSTHATRKKQWNDLAQVFAESRF